MRAAQFDRVRHLRNAEGGEGLEPRDEVPCHVDAVSAFCVKGKADSKVHDSSYEVDASLERKREDAALVFAQMEEHPGVLDGEGCS